MVEAQRIHDEQLLRILDRYEHKITDDSKTYRELYDANKKLQQIAFDARKKVNQLWEAHIKKAAAGEEDTKGAEVVAEAEATESEAFEKAMENAEKRAQAALNEARAHADDTLFAHLNLLKKGATEFKTQLGSYLKKSKKPHGQAENALNMALQCLAGGKFQAQNSGFDHTTGNGINTLKNFDQVADVVESVYPEGDPLHEKIKAAFVSFRKVASFMYDFVTYTKSQQKRDVTKFMELLDPLLREWDAAFPNKAYFLKLHHIAGHLPEFVELYGMPGRVSEESFESVHALMARIKRMVASMSSDQKRIQTMTAKAQTKLMPGAMDSGVLISEGVKGKARGPAKTKLAKAAGIVAVELGYTVVQVGEEEFIEILGGKGRLPRAWEELYLLVTAGRVPQSWRAAFNACIHLTEAEKQKVGYTNH